MKRLVLMILLTASLVVGCGSKNNAGDDGGDDAGGGDGGPHDAAIPPGCTQPDLSKPQCANCIDDDGDGRIDSFDLNCTGPLDNDEATFKTGIPGDNVDPVKQDCFFDGNSGAGNDGCDIHVCCILGATSQATCPIGANQYDPTKCPPPIGNTPLSQNCIDYCGALTPPGCDCFGCCTLCDPVTNICYDIATNPSTSPNCTVDVLSDPTKCLRCTQQTTCGDPDCGGSTCILCPGQDPNDLPAECNGMTTCPVGSQSCAMGQACPSQTYCNAAAGCCVGIIQ
jgi:hypothetical protein